MRSDINPELLALARELRGLTQADLASQAGVSQSKISKYESAMLRVSPQDLAVMAEQLDVPERLLLQSDRRRGPSGTHLFHRSLKRLRVRDQRRIHARIDLLRIRIDRLLRGIEFEPENSMPRIDIDAFDGDAEQIATIVRASWQLPAGPLHSLVEAMRAEVASYFAWTSALRT